MMKAHFILFLIVATLFSCKKNESDGTVYGKWKLTAVYADPGDGSGTYKKVSGTKKFLTFESDGTLTGDAVGNLTRFEIVNETTMKVYTTDLQSFTYGYTVTQSKLELRPPCIEGCGYRFERQ